MHFNWMFFLGSHKAEIKVLSQLHPHLAGLGKDAHADESVQTVGRIRFTVGVGPRFLLFSSCQSVTDLSFLMLPSGYTMWPSASAMK